MGVKRNLRGNQMPAKKKVWEAHIYLPEDIYRKIESLAEKNERSLTGQIRFMLTQQISSKGSGNE